MEVWQSWWRPSAGFHYKPIISGHRPKARPQDSYTTPRQTVRPKESTQSFPGKLELVPVGDKTKRYIEVGLIFGRDPNKDAPTESGRKKASAKKTFKPIERGEEMMRVFVPRTDFIQDSVKYYVGCRPEGGRFSPRVIRMGIVFFYPGFWVNVKDTGFSKATTAKLSIACKYHAADNKVSIDISPDQLTQVIKPNSSHVAESQQQSSPSVQGANDFMDFIKALTKASAKTFRKGIMID